MTEQTVGGELQGKPKVMVIIEMWGCFVSHPLFTNRL